MLHIAICDDEPYMLEELCQKVKRYMEEAHLPCRILCYPGGQELLDSPQTFDLIFLDIQMDGLSGMETAGQLRKRDFGGLLVFITVLKDYVFDSFEVGAFDYLLKPLDDVRFGRTMERILRQISSQKGATLMIHRASECSLLPLKDLVYCESINRKIYLHTITAEVIDYYCKMEDLERELGHDFFRCHRSYLLNLRYVRSYKNGMAYLSNGDKLPVSRLRGQDFSQAILHYLKEKRQ